MIPNWKIYPRSQGHSTVYLKNVVKDPTIQVGEYTTYDDYVNDPRDFERNCVLYHYPECNGDTLTIGKFCSIALRNGDCRPTALPLRRRGITMAASPSATMCGSAMRR